MDFRSDRRQHPRAFADFELSIGDRPVTVRDISRAGLCCVIDQPIKEMTELQLVLHVPQPDAPTTCVRCHGAVVRVDRLGDDEFELAILFLGIDEGAAEAIDTYVASQVDQPTP